MSKSILTYIYFLTVVVFMFLYVYVNKREDRLMMEVLLGTDTKETVRYRIR